MVSLWPRSFIPKSMRPSGALHMSLIEMPERKLNATVLNMKVACKQLELELFELD